MGLAAGTKLGSYEIVGPLGAGGMGEVYRARDTRLKREVAVKVLPAGFAQDPDRLSRFQREAELLATLNHPNIAAIYGLEQSGGVSAIVMELVEGETLAQKIAQASTSKTLAPGLPLDEAMAIATQIALALEAAHEKGVIHRDLKPLNIKITPDGRVKVLDFGLAKLLESETGSQALSMSPTLSVHATYAGMILGTAAYMSPEQARGKPVDRRADIWAFGCILFEMLTGKQAVDAGETVSDAIAAVLRGDPDWSALPADTPPYVRALLRRCLQKDPQKRLRDIGDARLEMDEGPTTPAAPAPSVAMQTPEKPRRAMRMVAAGLAAGICVTAAVAWAIVHFAPAPRLQPMRFAIVPPPAQSLVATGTDRQLAISPDGRNIVYVAGGSTQGTGQLVVRAIDRLDGEPLRGISGARFPFISPDGKWIGFFQGQTELKKVSMTGGPAITICRITGTPRGASWAPDDTIVFATGDPATGLLSVPAGGGDPKVLTKPDAAHGEADHWLPFVLPNGRGVLFTIPSPGQVENAQVAVLDLKTGQHKILIRGGSDAAYVDPSTSSGQATSTGSGQAGHLVYAALGTLRAVRFDPVKLEVFSDPVPVVEQVSMVGTGVAEFSVSRTGALVYSPGTLGPAAGGLVFSLGWVNRQGREEAINAPVRSYHALRLSPDDTRVALDIRDQENDVWVWDFAHQTLDRRTFDKAQDAFPVWTPDGRRLVFASARAGSPNLFWRSADGTGIDERLTTSANQQSASSVSPDGARLLIRESSGTTGDDIGLLEMPPKPKAQVTPLVQTAFSDRNGEISPDGRWMAYESNESGQYQIYVRPFPNVNEGRWQVSSGTKPSWARTGRELFYLDANRFLTVVPVQTAQGFSQGKPARLFEIKPAIVGVANGREYDVSRDGQRVIMIKEAAAANQTSASNESGPASLVVVLNWFEELKARLPAK